MVDTILTCSSLGVMIFWLVGRRIQTPTQLPTPVEKIGIFRLREVPIHAIASKP